MNRLLLLLLSFLAYDCRLFSQGLITFANRVPGGPVDARVTFLDGRPVGIGFTAQLYGALSGTAIADLKPLSPTTTFRTQPDDQVGYINPISFEVLGIEGGRVGIFVIKAFDGLSWESRSCRGESHPVEIRLASGLQAPALLLGVQPFSVNCIPEPSTVTQVLTGALTLYLLSRRHAPCRIRALGLTVF